TGPSSRGDRAGPRRESAEPAVLGPFAALHAFPDAFLPLPGQPLTLVLLLSGRVGRFELPAHRVGVRGVFGTGEALFGRQSQPLLLGDPASGTLLRRLVPGRSGIVLLGRRLMPGGPMLVHVGPCPLHIGVTVVGVTFVGITVVGVAVVTITVTACGVGHGTGVLGHRPLFAFAGPFVRGRGQRVVPLSRRIVVRVGGAGTFGVASRSLLGCLRTRSERFPCVFVVLRTGLGQ